MTKELTRAEHDTLETLINRYNLAAVLEAVADVCEDKAIHIRENWQDEQLARAWGNVSGIIRSGAMRPAVKAVS